MKFNTNLNGIHKVCRQTKQDINRSLVICLASILLLSIKIDLLSAAEDMKARENSKVVQINDSNLERDLPFRLDGGYTIGNPVVRNKYPGGYSGIDNPDKKLESKMFHFNISCSAARNGDINIYKQWKRGPKTREIRYANQYYSLQVIYFIKSIEKQYIYGMILDGRTLTDGIPVITNSEDWNCSLFK